MTPRLYRYLLVGSVVLSIVAGFFDMLFPAAVPDILRQAKEAKDNLPPAPFTALFGLAAIAIYITAVVGLYRFRSWAPRLALISTVAGILLNLLIGPSYFSAWANAMGEVSTLLWGAVLAMTFLSPLKEHFSRSGRRQSLQSAGSETFDTTSDELDRRQHELIATPEDQARWRQTWADIISTTNFSSKPPEEQRNMALNAACRLLGVQETEANHHVPAVQELADVLLGNMESSELRQQRLKNRLAFLSICAFLGFGMGLVCLFTAHPWLAAFCLLFGMAMIAAVKALRSGKPAWVTELFMDYFW